MTERSLSKQYADLAKECERQAREAERLSIDPALDVADRIAHMDRAKALWQARGDSIETAMRLDAERGRKVGTGAKVAAEMTNAQHGPLRERRFSRLTELIPTMGLHNAAHQCEAEGLGKYDAIVRQWNRHQQK